MEVNHLLGEAADAERWRAHTGLRSLCLVLVRSSEAEINAADGIAVPLPR